jgi:hypothetical protein
LSIPAVRDRVAQAALKTVLEPIFEADFLPCSFGFRPRKSAHDALQVLIDESESRCRNSSDSSRRACERLLVRRACREQPFQRASPRHSSYGPAFKAASRCSTNSAAAEIEASASFLLAR